jgi:hypothetical protein
MKVWIEINIEISYMGDRLHHSWALIIKRIFESLTDNKDIILIIIFLRFLIYSSDINDTRYSFLYSYYLIPSYHSFLT